MGLYLNPGNGMFQNVLNGRFYVDKTKLAVFMNERLNTPDGFVCVSRPRRFGKSVDADMLVAYYTCGADSREQFAGLDISGDPTFQKHLNAHNVIKLNIAQMLSLTDSAEDVGRTISSELIGELRDVWPEAVPPEETSLARALSRIHSADNTRFVFVIDEWDCVMREAADNEAAQRSYLDFLRDLFKDRPYIEAAYMTGILPIRKYGMHSALNLFTEYSMTYPDTMAALMGFNENDVKQLCTDFGMDFPELARWYDGYLLGKERIHVYNPRSVAGAIGSLECRSFWASTETYEALQRYIDIDFDGVASDLVLMLDRARIPAEVEGFPNTMTGLRDKNDMYALLVHLGYLGYDQEKRAVFIPNEEIRREFDDLQYFAVTEAQFKAYKEIVRNNVARELATPEGIIKYCLYRYSEGKDLISLYSKSIDRVAVDDVRLILEEIITSGVVEYVVKYFRNHNTNRRHPRVGGGRDGVFRLRL